MSALRLQEQLNNLSNGEENHDVVKRRPTSSRRPFGKLTNTPSKVKSIQNLSKPMKPLFSRSVSAPLPQSPVLEERPTEVDTVDSEVASIFRATTISEEPEDMWTLKRATPIDESEDEESVYLMESPTKRIRRTFSFYDPFPESRDEEESQIVELSWNTQICETASGFNLVL